MAKRKTLVMSPDDALQRKIEAWDAVQVFARDPAFMRNCGFPTLEEYVRATGRKIELCLQAWEAEQ